MRRASHPLRLLTSVLCTASAATILPYSLLLWGQNAQPDLSVPDSVLALHLTRVMKMLPEGSGPPPFGDLTKDIPPGADKKWEARFTGSLGVRPIVDPGVHSLEEATSISLTTTDFVGSPPALPVRSSVIVGIGVPIASTAHLAKNSRFVYSLYDVRLEAIWKDDRKRRKGQSADQVVECAEIGGSVRFLSGHVGTFLESKEGFLKLGARYLLFLWKPVADDQTLMLNEGYLLQGEHVFPLSLSFREGRYSGMPQDKFLSEVKAAVKSGADVE